MKKTILSFAFLSMTAQALSLAEIKSAMALVPPMATDSLWIEVDQKVQSGTSTSVQHLKMVSLGRDWMKTEMETPLGKQIIVRQPGLLLTKLGNSGQVMRQKIAVDSTHSNSILPQTNQVFGNWDFKDPVKDGVWWKLESRSNLGEQGVLGRTLWYNSAHMRVEKIAEQRENGVETTTQIQYCDTACAIAGSPKTLVIETKSSQHQNRIEMNFSQFRRVQSLPASFFDLK